LAKTKIEHKKQRFERLYYEGTRSFHKNWLLFSFVCLRGEPITVFILRLRSGWRALRNSKGWKAQYALRNAILNIRVYQRFMKMIIVPAYAGIKILFLWVLGVLCGQN